ncbi:leucine zipper domain-containing protein [Euzebya pacifica]|uniref:leucine zipper domain-containing protein n=1 Tax=Euzebya pacifica TaxID=1608957 RepID=UPI000DF86726|nr:leucine zipper domain-containing protein [Euzebya pacifica]
MQHRSHRRARLTIEGRRLLVHRVEELGWPAARAAEAMGVSRATAYKWLRRFREEGDAGLADRSSRPHHLANRIDVGREIAIVRCRRQTLQGPHRIGWELGEAPSTVNRVLRRNDQPRLADIGLFAMKRGSAGDGSPVTG